MDTSTRVAILCALAYLVGVASFFFYHDMVAKNTYVSENALMPGSGRLTYGHGDLQHAQQFTSEFHEHITSTFHKQASAWAKAESDNHTERADQQWSSLCSDWIARAFSDRGLDTHIYWTNTNGVVVTGIQRAGKGDGTEGIVLSASFAHHSNVSFTRVQTPRLISPSAVGGVGLLLSIIDHLSHCKWLAKDIVYVVADSSHSISHWLKAYHNGTLPLWGGALQAALHIGLRPWPVDPPRSTEGHHDATILIHLDGSNGQFPNLDMVNTLTHFAKVYHLRSSISLPVFPLGRNFESFIDQFGGTITEESMYLLAFMLRQAIGVPSDPNGPHPYFNQYNIDAISLDVDRESMDHYEAGGGSIALPLVVLGVMRSLNNLLEHLHQSFYYYLLYRPTRYISIGHYMISLGLIVAPMLVHTLYGLYWLSGGQLSHDTSKALNSVSPRTIIWNAMIAALLHIGGITLYGVPLLFGVSIQSFWVIFATNALLAFVVIYYSPIKAEIFLMFTAIPTIVFIASMSLLNFSFCVFVAAVVVPIYTSIAYLHNKINLVAQLVLVVVSMPTILYIIGLLCQIPSSLEVLDTIMSQHIEHGTLLYPFLTLVYTPLNFGYFFILWKTHK